MIGQTISHYRITAQLGGGGMGVVYKAVDTKLDRPVALKFLPPELTRDPDAKRRFVHEAKAASALQHHNICTIHEIDETAEGQLFIAMDCYEGETLKERIARGPLAVREAVEIAAQVAEGLAEAHQAGMVHRDIKPANILVTERGVVKIVDFGLAKLAGQTKVTKTGSTVGTVSYMSPEQARGEDVDARSDMFSLGAVLYELLTGTPPFTGGHHAAILYAIMNTVAESPAERRREVPPELGGLVQKTLSKDPLDRYQSMAELVNELHRYGKGAAPVDRAETPKRASRIRAVLIAVVAASITVTGYVFLSRYISQRPREAVPELKMLAVLPFENLGAAEDEYFADGMTEEITARLAGVRELGVIARTSAMQYKDTRKSIKQIGEELGVQYVIEGTVRWQRDAGDRGRVRITPQLIRVADATHIWADVYDEPLVEIFKIQTDVADRVVQALNVTLVERERAFLNARPTDSVSAMDAYMQANAFFSRRHLESAERMRMAIRYYEVAAAADPEFASAFAMMAWAYTELYWHQDRKEEFAQKATSAIERARSLGPDALEVQLVSGVFDYHFLMYDKAIGELTSLLERNPNNAAIMAELAYVHTRKGNWAASITLLTKALQLDPRSHSVAFELADRYKAVRRYEDAEAYYDRAIALSPDIEWAYIEKALLYLARDGNARGARRVLDEADQVVTRSPRFEAAQKYCDLCAGKYPTSAEQYPAAPSGPEGLDMLFSSPGVWGAALETVETPEAVRDYYRTVVDIAEHDDEPDLWGGREAIVAIGYAGLGRKDVALAKAMESVRLGSRTASREPLALQSLARVYVMCGDYEEAVEVLERIITMPGDISAQILRLDPRWAALREHPGFQRLLERYGVTDS